MQPHLFLKLLRHRVSPHKPRDPSQNFPNPRQAPPPRPSLIRLAKLSSHRPASPAAPANSTPPPQRSSTPHSPQPESAGHAPPLHTTNSIAVRPAPVLPRVQVQFRFPPIAFPRPAQVLAPPVHQLPAPRESRSRASVRQPSTPSRHRCQSSRSAAPSTRNRRAPS